MLDWESNDALRRVSFLNERLLPLLTQAIPPHFTFNAPHSTSTLSRNCHTFHIQRDAPNWKLVIVSISIELRAPSFIRAMFLVKRHQIFLSFVVCYNVIRIRISGADWNDFFLYTYFVADFSLCFSDLPDAWVHFWAATITKKKTFIGLRIARRRELTHR